MNPRILLAPLSLAVACSNGVVSTNPLSQNHAPLRSPCEASDAPLIQVAKLSCSNDVPSPAGSDRDVWRGALPTSVAVTTADGAPISEAHYDYSQPRMFPHAVYRDDGNIESATFDEAFPEGNGPVLHFTYDGSTLVGEYASWMGADQAQTEFVYQDGMRHYDGLVASPRSRWNYRYDDQGQIIARLGSGALDVMPAAPEASLLSQVCHGLKVGTIAANQDINTNMGATYYFRDASGRVIQTIQGRVPGLAFSKSTYNYDGDKLVSVVTECSESTEPSQGNVIRTYSY